MNRRREDGFVWAALLHIRSTGRPGFKCSTWGMFYEIFLEGSWRQPHCFCHRKTYHTITTFRPVTTRLGKNKGTSILHEWMSPSLASMLWCNPDYVLHVWLWLCFRTVTLYIPHLHAFLSMQAWRSTCISLLTVVVLGCTEIKVCSWKVQVDQTLCPTALPSKCMKLVDT